MLQEIAKANEIKYRREIALNFMECSFSQVKIDHLSSLCKPDSFPYTSLWSKSIQNHTDKYECKQLVMSGAQTLQALSSMKS